MLLLVGSSGVRGQGGAADIREVFDQRHEADYPAAAEAYLARIGEAGSSVVPAELQEDLAQLALILPDSLVGRLSDTPSSTLGAVLATWWKRQDPLPSTPLNERVIEHLLRVSTARSAFASGAPTGFDARGDTFVRFGSPARRRVIDFENDLFIARAIRDEPTVRRSDFPRNEAWHYPALGPDVYFLFIERRGAYEEGEPTDLLPPALMAGGISYETSGRARLLGQALRWIYKDLHTYSSDIRNRLLTLDSTVGGDGAAFSGNTALVLQTELQRARLSDAQAREARDEALPLSVTSVRRRRFGVIRRTAVFLDDPPDADTYSVWTGWAQDPSPLWSVADSLSRLGLSPERFVVGLTTVEYTPTYERGAASENLFLIDSGLEVTAPQWSIVEGIERGGHVAFEWDLYPSTPQGEVLPPGAVAADVEWVDSVAVEWAGDVALSGVLPIDGRVALAMDDIDRLRGLPPAQFMGSLPGGEPIGLYFEVYGRRPGIELQIEVRAIKIREGRILRPERDITTASATRTVLDGVRRPELAVVDVGDLDGADRLRLEVVVTDLGTSESARQSVTLDLD